MPVSKELLDKIAAYEGEQNTPDDIVAGLAASQNFPDIAEKVKAYQAQGHSAIDILEGIKTSPIIPPVAPVDIPQEMAFPGDAMSPELAPESTGPSALSILGRGMKQVPESMARTGANIVRGVGEIEKALTPTGVPNVLVDAGNLGKEAADTYSNILREREQRDTAGLGRFEKILYQAPASIAANAPAIAAGVASGGVAPALTVMGSGKLADKFAEFIDSGRGIPASLIGASASAGAEVLPEIIPMGWLLNKGTPAIKAVLQYAIGEQAQEQITTLADNLIDWGMKNPSMTLKDWWENVQKPAIVDTAISTAIQAPAVGALARGSMALADKFPQRKAEEAGPGPAPAPPVGAPPAGGDSTTPPASTSETPPITPTEPSEPPPAAPTPDFEPAYPGASKTHRQIFDMSPRDPAFTQEDAAYRLEHDDLTGLKNRSEFFRMLKEDTKDGTETDAGQIDFDKFKPINDNFGHGAGDTVLREFGNVIRTIGLQDHVFRVGGEEFGVRGLGKNHDAIIDLINRHLENVEINAVDKSGAPLLWWGLPFSHGRATIKSHEEFKTNVDKALYDAKEARKSLRPEGNRISPGVRLSPETERLYRQRIGETPAGSEAGSEVPGPDRTGKEGEGSPRKQVEPAALPEPSLEGSLSDPTHITIEPKRPAPPTTRQKHFIKSSAEAMRGITFDNYYFENSSEEIIKGNRQWSNRGIIAPFSEGVQFSDKNRPEMSSDELAIEILERAAEGKFPPYHNNAKWRLINEALLWHERGAQNAEFQAEQEKEAKDKEDADEVPFDLFNGEPEAPKQKKVKPSQPKLNMGQVKGEDLAAKKKEGTKAAEESPLFEDVKRRKDEAKQEKMFDIAGEYSEETATRSRAAFETPEIVRLIKKLTGQYPKVAPGQIKTAMGIALGFYEPSSKKITVSEKAAEIEALVKRVLAHEFGHRVHNLGDPETMKRGNILGIIAGFRKYMKKTLPEYQGAPDEVLSQQDRSRLRSEAEKEARQAIKAEKAANESEDDLLAGKRKVSPEEIKAIWNDVAARDKDPDLYDYISRLTAAQKKSVLIEAMRGISNVEFQKQIHDKKYSDLDDKIKEIFKKKIKEEIEKRKLYDAEIITEELKQIVRLVKPFNENDPKMVKQYFKPAELYADGASMVLIDPEFAKATAPNFYKAFHSWMDVRPEFKAEYDNILGMLEGDREALLKEYQDEINKGYDAHEQAIKKQIEASKIKSLHNIYSHLVDGQSAYWKLINKKEKEGVVIPPEKDPRYWLTENAYVNAEVYAFLKTHYDEVGTVLRSLKISNETFGNFFQHMRVINERSKITDEQGSPYTDKANPHGHTKESSQEILDKMKRDMGDEKYAVLEKAYKDFQDNWQEFVIKTARESGMWSEALLKYSEANRYYAKFRTVENFSDALDDHFGGGDAGAAITGHVFNRHGSFQDIANPYIQTVIAGTQIIRAAHVNQAKKHSTEFLMRNYGPDTITRARQKWNGKFKETKIVNNERVGTVIYLEGGKPQAFYVKREIADIINSNPESANDFVRVMMQAVAPAKALQVKYNVLWAMRNIPRDFWDTLKKEHGIKDPITLAYWYLRAIPHAYRDVSGRPLNDTLLTMYKNKMLAPDRLYGTVDHNEVDEYEKMMESYVLSDVRYRNKVAKPISKIFETIEGTTKFSERLSKIAGGLYNLRQVEKGKRSMKEAVYSVHEFWGTPNVFRRGIWGKWTNAIAVYSNVNIQGVRAHAESAKEHPFVYAYKTTLMNILPAVITAGLAAGWFRYMMDDDEDEKMKEWHRKVSNYQRDRYIPIALGFDSNDKAVGIKIPMDFVGTAVYGTVLAGLEGRYGNNGMFRTMWEQNPYLSPMLVDFVADMIDYARGRELYDDFRGRPAIDPDVHKAGGSRKAAEIAKYEWNKLGGSTLHRFNTDDPSRIKSDLEKSLQEYPGKLASSFLFVSDYGIKESAREKTDEGESVKASKRLEVKDAIRSDIESHGGKPMPDAPYKLWEKLYKDGKVDPREQKPRQFAATYDRYMRGGADNVRLETLMRADVDGRLILMDKYEGDLSPEKYNALRDQAIAEGLLKKSFWKKSALRGGL